MITDGEIADACNKAYIKAGHNAYFGNGFEAGVRFALEQVKNCSIPAVIGSPILAKIEHINDLGKSKWYEVVYYDDGWYSYAGSKTFQDGEQVVDWKYCKDCL